METTVGYMLGPLENQPGKRKENEIGNWGSIGPIGFIGAMRIEIASPDGIVRAGG